MRKSLTAAAAACFVGALSLSASQWAGRTVVENFHADLSASYDVVGGEWRTQLDLGEFDDPGLLFDFDDALVVVSDVLEDEVLPEDEGSFFGGLGPTGTSFWIIPQTSQPGVIHLGFNAFGVSQGVMQASSYPSLAGQDVFNSGRVDFVLRDYAGPGSFVVYRTGPNFSRQIYMDSREIGQAGVDNLVPEAAGGHSHAVMLFVGRGLHAVTMRNEGVLASGGQFVAGPDRSIPFLVAPRGKHWWLLNHFSFSDAVYFQEAMTASVLQGGIPLLLCYAFDLDPIEPDVRGLPQVVRVETGPVERLALEMRRPTGTVARDDRQDLEYIVEWSRDLEEWFPATVSWESLGADGDGTPRRRAVIEDFTLAEEVRAFARVRVVALD